MGQFAYFMALGPGRRLGHYEILAPLGAGGMGVVYRARDLKLNRDVALKVLPPHRQFDTGRRARFTREAQAAAATKHPNIAVIYDIDESDGVVFIAMELVEGEPLSDVLGRGGLPSIGPSALRWMSPAGSRAPTTVACSIAT